MELIPGLDKHTFKKLFQYFLKMDEQERGFIIGTSKIILNNLNCCLKSILILSAEAELIF